MMDSLPIQLFQAKTNEDNPKGDTRDNQADRGNSDHSTNDIRAM